MCDVYANGWFNSTIFDDLVIIRQSPSSFSPENENGYRDEEIEKRRCRMQKVWGLGYGPLLNFSSLSEERGVITSTNIGWRASRGLFFLECDRPFVFLHPTKLLPQERVFDVAHEVELIRCPRLVNM